MMSEKGYNWTFWLFLLMLMGLLMMSWYRHSRRSEPMVHSGEWLTDFEAAKQLAQEQHKDLLVNFAGSDWCYWCKRLDAEVFSDYNFIASVQKDFVLVLIDFPADKSGQPQSLQEQNQKLAGQFAIEGYPTDILMDKDGNSYARTGYQEGGAKAYLAHLKELQSKK
jgi:thioredoxin-related protein